MRFTKIIALTLASAITLTTLTSCASDSGGGIFEASVKQVEDKPYNMDGIEGTYTGDWKSGCPNGNGTLIVDDYEFYSGEWSDGMLVGHGEMRKAYDDGTWRYYNGECLFNQPFGQGQLFTGISDGSYTIEIDGDFSDESTLMYYETDGNGKLINIGGIQNSEYVSYIWNPDVVGINFQDWVRNSIEGAYYYTEAYEGCYIGQIDNNNVPNGYGYSVSNKYDRYVYKLGTWKDGKIEGYYTEWWYNNGKWSTRIGYMEDGVDVGECTTYTEYSDYKLVTSMDCQAAYEYQLCDDGKYRTDYVTKEYFYNNGIYKVEKYLTLRTDLNGWEYYYEGDYTITDAYGNAIECGMADPDPRSSCTLYWISCEDYQKREIWNTLAPIVAIGLVVGVGAYTLTTWDNDFESSAAGQFLDSTRKSIARETEQRELREEAKDEFKNGHYEKAKELLREAESLYWP